VETLRYVHCDDKGARIVDEGSDDCHSKIVESLGVLPDHNVRLFVAVEGRNDENFLKRISAILHKADSSIPDLGELEESGDVVFIPVGGSNLKHWTSRLAKLPIPEIYLADRENQPPAQPKYAPEIAQVEKRRESGKPVQGVHTDKKELENYLHPDAISAEAHHSVNLEFGDWDDVPEIVARAVHEASDSNITWDDLTDEMRERKASNAKKWLNMGAAEHMTPELLDERDASGFIRNFLSRAADMLASEG
jgi:hypothetical protein